MVQRFGQLATHMLNWSLLSASSIVGFSSPSPVPLSAYYSVQYYFPELREADPRVLIEVKAV